MSLDRSNRFHRIADASRAVTVVTLGAVLALGLLAERVLAQTFTRITTGALVTDGGASRSVNWVDIDGDRDLDLFVSNGPNPGQLAFLYRNDGAPNWTFTKITNDPIVLDAGRSDGASFADVDNDGDLDAEVATWYGDVDYFYLGDGAGGFTKVTTQPPATTGAFSESCSWGDYDGDHLLDLYVANSGNATAEVNHLFHNDGGGAFTRILTGPAATDAFRTRGVNWVDYDDDGDQDLFAVNENNQAENLYRNDGGGVFTPIVGDPLVSSGGSSWTASWGDIDNDGDLDVYVGNSGGQNDLLFTNDGDGTFTKILGDPVVTSGGWTACSGWGDYDNDGDLDLFTTNAYGGGAKVNFLFTNMLRESGILSFVKVTGVPLVTETGWSYGFAWGDYDQDGDLDIFQARTFNDTENNALYRNDEANGASWLTCQLVGVISNRSALGAKVRVRADLGGDDVRQTRVVEGQSGYCGQNLELHFGMGAATTADSVIVEWPSGQIDVLTDVPTNQRLVLVEGGGTTGVDDPAGAMRGALQISPNPFRDRTVFELSLERPGDLRLDVFDAGGRFVARLLDGPHSAGRVSAAFEPSARQGAGVFLYQLTQNDRFLTGKVVRQR